MSSDEFSLRYSDLVTGSYDCVDRIVLNAFYPLGYHPGGLRTWWRRLARRQRRRAGQHPSDADGRALCPPGQGLGRGQRGAGDLLSAGERKHRIAEAYLATHDVGIGVFLVLVAKAPAPVWKVARSAKTGAIC